MLEPDDDGTAPLNEPLVLLLMDDGVGGLGCAASTIVAGCSAGSAADFDGAACVATCGCVLVST
jgi:hypothetical protein